eukprot:13137444-Ditylum_brightwellii.AAC.2
MMVESVLITVSIEANEGREVATTDIPGAYLLVEMDELVHMKLEGRLAELLKKDTICETKEGLIWMSKSALFFYRKLSGELIENGFEIKPYSQCVANNMIDGKQLTVTWHVDDLEVSHKKKQV